MRIDKIVLKGFRSHQDTTIDFGDARLVCLTGENGAGKSTILVSANYALWGRHQSDYLVALGSSEMSAAVELEVGGVMYRLTRGRTTKSGGRSFLELQMKDGAGWMPLTADDIRSTQQAITELLGLDQDAFASAVWLSQGQGDRFANAAAVARTAWK